MKKIIVLIACFIYLANVSAQSIYFTQAHDSATKYIIDNHLKDWHNTYIDKNKVIHIFIFEDGNLLIKGYPTTATEKSRFQVHLFKKISNKDPYWLEYAGSYNPIFTVQNIGARGIVEGITRVDFAVLGPFTGSVTLTLKHLAEGAKDPAVLITTTIQISQTIYASIGSGFIYTTLRDPANIRTVALSGGDSTLVADDNRGRGMLTALATFYPWGRNNLLIPDWNFQDRFGILVGTSIGEGSSNFKNFYLGAQYDFAIGGSFIGGIHYGQRQKVSGVDYSNFNFGQSKFTGNLEEKKYMAWDAGVFIGVQVDSRIFSQIFSK